jgi:hypothetical protein
LSILDLNNMTKESIISHYLLECWENSFFLTYNDHAIIKAWLIAANNDEDLVLVILEEIMNSLIDKFPEKKRLPIKIIDKYVREKIILTQKTI